MTSLVQYPDDVFIAPERDLIRRELGMRLGHPPSSADVSFLRTKHGSQQAQAASGCAEHAMARAR
jgi:hypothetical protein